MKNSTHTSTQNKYVTMLIILSVSLLFLTILEILFGQQDLSLKEFFISLNNKESTTYQIIKLVRIPEAISAILVGAGLSVSGLLLQTMLNNSLASPSIIGINSGAALSVVIISLFIPYSIELMTISTIIGAFLSSMLIYLIAAKTGASRGKLILAGVAISRLLSALMDALLYMFPNKITLSKQEFSLGSFSFASTNSLIIAGPIILIGLIGAFIILSFLFIHL